MCDEFKQSRSKSASAGWFRSSASHDPYAIALLNYVYCKRFFFLSPLHITHMLIFVLIHVKINLYRYCCWSCVRVHRKSPNNVSFFTCLCFSHGGKRAIYYGKQSTNFISGSKKLKQITNKLYSKLSIVLRAPHIRLAAHKQWSFNIVYRFIGVKRNEKTPATV